MSECVIGPRIGKNGYARYPGGSRGIYLYAHRVEWEREHGPIPDGHQIHHVCGTKACINVEHMELKSSFREHMREHPPERKCDHTDRYTDGRGKSVCRICERVRARNRYATDPVYRAKKIARAAETKRRRKEVLHERSLVHESV